MLKNSSLFALICLLSYACSSKKYIAVPLAKEVNKQELKYTFISSNVVGDSLNVKVQYGGGCIRPHIFNVMQTPRIKPNEVNIWLLHKTLDDRCKALVRVEHNFDIAPLLQDSTVTSIKLNGLKELLPQPKEELPKKE